ncbi:hypothetical protein AVEN_89926-1 [Araneus ventricosus]|uniref:Uncharacterized protein n=1 Tax=Araneus ventricosus TaxID=182803 RepID=A0A4Y2NZU2_ARAVE|nr:hypothetical protein AVEN_89926-1 [Araneus ventricosus]
MTRTESQDDISTPHPAQVPLTYNSHIFIILMLSCGNHPIGLQAVMFSGSNFEFLVSSVFSNLLLQSTYITPNVTPVGISYRKAYTYPYVDEFTVVARS